MTTLGIHKARGIIGSEQFTTSGNGALLIGLDMALDDGAVMTVTFSFSGDAGQYSFQKLRQLGWQSPDDPFDLRGIDANEVDVNVFEEEYQGKTQLKCELVRGGGFKFKTGISAQDKARIQAQLKGPARATAGQASASRPTTTSAKRTNGTTNDRPFAVDADAPGDANDDLPY